MYPGLPSRLEKEMKQLYLSKVLNGDGARLKVSFFLCSFGMRSLGCRVGGEGGGEGRGGKRQGG